MERLSKYYQYEEESSGRGKMIIAAMVIGVAFAAIVAYKLITEPGWKSYESREYGFSVDYPGDWVKTGEYEENYEYGEKLVL